MYTIKLTEDKGLITTNRVPLYQGETNLDTLGFLVPKQFRTIDVDKCTVQMHYIRPTESNEHSIALSKASYNDVFFVYTTQITNELTAIYGRLTVWLTLVGELGDVLLESGKAAVLVTCRGSDRPTPPGPSPDPGGSGELQEEVDLLKAGKADSLVYDPDTQQLQLTAEGVRIGDAVTIQLNSYEDTYEVTPGIYEEVTLATKNKAMKEDVVVHKVPQYEVSNEAGGTTLIMGDEYYG